MGTKNSPGNFDCYSNALDDEPMFILLARDRHASSAVLNWCDARELELHRGFGGDRRKFAEEMQQLNEARDCAAAMQKWRTANMGVWKGALSNLAVPDRSLAPVEVGFLPELPSMLDPEAADDERCLVEDAIEHERYAKELLAAYSPNYQLRLPFPSTDQSQSE